MAVGPLGLPTEAAAAGEEVDRTDVGEAGAGATVALGTVAAGAAPSPPEGVGAGG